MNHRYIQRGEANQPGGKPAKGRKSHNPVSFYGLTIATDSICSGLAAMQPLAKMM